MVRIVVDDVTSFFCGVSAARRPRFIPNGGLGKKTMGNASSLGPSTPTASALPSSSSFVFVIQMMGHDTMELCPESAKPLLLCMSLTPKILIRTRETHAFVVVF